MISLLIADNLFRATAIEYVLCNTKHSDWAHYLIDDNKRFAWSLSDRKKNLKLIGECIISSPPLFIFVQVGVIHCL